MRTWALCLAALLASFGCRPAVQRVFSVPTQAPTRAGLLALEDGVVAANESGRLIRVAASGQVLWETSVGHEIPSAPVAVSDVGMVATALDEWVGFDLDSGSVRWRLTDRPPLAAPLASDPERAFALGTDGSVRALVGSTGELAWELALPLKAAARWPRGRGVPPRVVGGRLVVAVPNQGLFALRTSDGEQAWHQPIDAVALVDRPAQSDRVFALGSDGMVRALAIDSGRELEVHPLGKKALPILAAAHGGLWVGMSTGTLARLDPSRALVESGRVELDSPLAAAPAELGPYLAVPLSGREGRVRLLRPALGAREPSLELRVDSQVRTAPVSVGGVLVVLPIDGRVLGFRLSGPAAGQPSGVK